MKVVITNHAVDRLAERGVSGRDAETVVLASVLKMKPFVRLLLLKVLSVLSVFGLSSASALPCGCRLL
jgi:CII-binding regulator of phage lambda lysogenization HflD